MKNLKHCLFFIAFSFCSFAQAQPSKTEAIFKRYLVSEDEAIARTIINSQDDLYSYYCQGNLSEDVTKRITYFSKFIEKEPKLGLAKAYLNRGIAFTVTEKYNEAILDLDKSIELDKNLIYAYYFRGVSSASLEKHTEAITNYASAIKLQTNFSLAYYMRALSFISLENYEPALIDLNKVIELNSDSDQGFTMRGVVYYKTEKYEKAISDWKQAKKLNKDNEQSIDEKIAKAEQKLKEKA